MSPFLIFLSPPDRQIRQTNGRIIQTGGRTGRIDLVKRTDRLIGWTDAQTKQTNVQMEGRTDGRADGLGRVYKQTRWTRWTDGREGPDRLDWTDGQDGRTGWTDGGVDRLDGRTERKDGLTRWMDWTDGRTNSKGGQRDGRTN